MIEPITKTIDGMKFNFKPLPAMKAIKLDKKVVTLIMPVLGGFKELSLDAKVDMEVIAKGLGEALGNITDEDFEKLTLDLLSGVVYLEEGKAPQEIDANVVNLIFQGKLMSLYKLMFEVMRYNKFSPFGLVEGGSVMKKIHTLLDTKAKEKKNGNRSGLLESSKEN